MGQIKNIKLHIVTDIKNQTMRWVLNRYLVLLSQHPWKTTSLSTGLLVGVGDAVSQRIIEKNETHNLRRNLKMTCLGTFFIGPAQLKMYTTVDRLWPLANHISILKKMLVTQLVWAPFIIGAIFLLSDALDGRGINDIAVKFQTSYFRTLGTGYLIWPLAQCLIFSFVPLHLRVLVTNFIALFWNTYLTWVVNSRNVVKDTEHKL